MKFHFVLAVGSICIALLPNGCGGGGGGSTSPTQTTNSIALQLASPTITATDSSSGSDAVTVTRTGTTGNLTFSLTGLPTGATASFVNPANGDSGQISVTLTTVAAGTYPLTLAATDGTNTASATLSLVVNSNLALQLANPTLTVSDNSSVSDAITLIRTGTTTGKVTFGLTGLPAGATVSFLNPGTTNSGEIDVMATTAAAGTYALTLQATDGTNSASSNISLVVSAGTPAVDPYAWTSTGPIISAIPDATHPIVSVKDPTAVFYNNQWIVYATTADTAGNWNMVNLIFPSWDQASAAKPYYMDATPGLSGYHCAPELFYFAPQNKWYLLYQSGPPTYSTAADPTQPQTWTAPQYFSITQPPNVNWLDFWITCDSANCYLFFPDDGGDFYRSQTTVANFPNGFSTPQLIMNATTGGDLFESARVYSMKGSTQYLLIVEAMGGSSGHRYFRAFMADSLDGIWTPVTGANSFAAPFLGSNNVTLPAGVTPWTLDFSHGEVLRTGYDQTLQIDPNNLQFLYQGSNPNANVSSYSQIPYQLGLATATSH